MSKILVTTLGCKANQADSEDIAARYLSRGYSLAKKGEVPDICVVNTCTVTAKADSRCRNAIHKLKKLYPAAKMIVTGCMANVAEEELKRMKDVDTVIQTSDFRLPTSAERNQKTRPQLKIQDGCDNYCTYCIVPYARGKSRSLPVEDVVSRVEGLKAAGAQEIVLTGIHLGAYGKDLKPKTSLVNLLQKICHPRESGDLMNTIIYGRSPRQYDAAGAAITTSGMTDNRLRLRLSSIEPDEFSPEFLAFLAKACRTGHICPHFHIPLQSGTDEILKAMGRKYTTENYRALLGQITALLNTGGSQKSDVRCQISDLRHPTSSALPTSYFLPPTSSVAIGADVIVGFPGETAELFERTVKFIESLPIAYLHVFPYSPRPLTAAYKLKNTASAKEKQRRVAELCAISEGKQLKFYKSQIDKKLSVVTLRKRDKKTGLLKGISENYVPVLFEGGDELMGRECDVKVEEVRGLEVRGQKSEVGNLRSEIRLLTSDF